jgi:hypothetical protein
LLEASCSLPEETKLHGTTFVLGGAEYELPADDISWFTNFNSPAIISKQHHQSSLQLCRRHH